MDFVNEQHVVRLQIGEQTREVGGLVEHGAGGHLDAGAQLVGDDVGERGFAQAGGAMQQHVVEGVAALLGGGHEHLQVFENLVLPRKVVETKRAQGLVNVLVGGVEAVGATREIRFAHEDIK